MRAPWLPLLLAGAVLAQEGEGEAVGHPMPQGREAEKGEGLLRRTRDPDAGVRAKAMRGLGREGGERAVDAARRALDDADASVRAAAAVTLVRLDAPDARVVEALVAALRDPDWYTRWDACIALGSLGGDARSAAPALVAAAGDRDLDLCREAVAALLRIAANDPQVLGHLTRLLESDLDFDRRPVLKALDVTGQIAIAQDWLAKELISDRHGLRAKAAYLLGRCGVAGAAYVKEALKSENPGIRATAIHQLDREQKIGPDAFVATLRDPAPEMRRAAIDALARRKAVEAAPAIAALLSDPDAGPRLGAAKALVELNVPVPEAGPGLVRLFGDGDMEFGAFGDSALDAMRSAGFAALATFLECAHEPGPGGRHVRFVRLRPSNSEDLSARVDLLVLALVDNRHGAPLVAALNETLAPDEDRVLVDGLAAEDPELRRAAAILLGHLARDREAAARALGKARGDRHPDVRDAAAAAIERLGVSR